MPLVHLPISRRPLALAVSLALLPVTVTAVPVNWVPDADGFWDIVTNWSSNPALPSAADDVTIDVGGATLRTITHRSGTNTIASLTSQENFSLTGGTLNLNGASTIAGAFVQSGGTLGGTGTLTVTGASLANGTMSGSGTTIVQGTTTVTGANFGLDSGRILRNVGTVNWTSGTLNLNATASGGSGRIDNALGALFDAQGNNTLNAIAFGDLNTLAGFPAFNNAGTFRKSTGTGTTTVDVAFNNTGSVDVQSGTLSLSAGGSSVAGTFTSAGTLDFSGAWTTDAATTISTLDGRFSGAGNKDIAGSYTSSGATTFSGSGISTLSGTIALGSALTVSGGTANLLGAGLSLVGTDVGLSSGTLNVGALTGAVDSYVQTGGTLNGSGTLTLTGASLANGIMSGSGTTIVQGTTTVTGANFGLDSGRILRNVGTVNWTSGTLNLNATASGGSGRIDNALGALFDAQGNNTLNAIAFGDLNTLAGFPAFNNAGTFRKSTGTGTTTVDVAFNNTGAVDVQSGTLSLSAGGSSVAGTFTSAGTLDFSGAWTTDAATTISTLDGRFSGAGNKDIAGSYTSSGATTFSGSGISTLSGTIALGSALTVSGGTANLLGAGLSLVGTDVALSSGTLNVGALTGAVDSYVQTGGTLNGSGTLTLTGASLANGIMSGSGTTIVQGTTTVTGANFGLDSGRILRNVGTVNWTSGTLNLNATASGGSGRIDNALGALFDAQGNNTLNAIAFGDLNALVGFPAFNNAGTFRKSTGTGTTTVDVAFNNTGAVDVQSGTLSLSAGGSSVAGTFTSAGTLDFSGAWTTDAATTISTLDGRFSGAGNKDIAGSYTSSGATTFSGSGISTLSGTIALGSALTVSGGTANLLGAGLSLVGTDVGLSSGTLNVGALTGAVDSYVQTGGTLNGSGTLTLTGASLANGIMSGSGTTIVQGTTTVTGANFGLDSGRILRNVGTVNWTSGTLNLNATASGGSGRIDNALGALFDAQGNNTLNAIAFGDLNALVGFPAFNNAGTFRKSTGTGTTTVDVAFNNTGAVDVQSGTLSLSAGGSSVAGTFTSAGTLDFSGAWTTDAATTISTLDGRFSGAGNKDIAGSYTSSGATTFSGSGISTLSGTIALGSALTVSGGTANLLGAGLSLVGTDVALSSGTLNVGALTGAVDSYVQTGGTLNGSGTLTLTGASLANGIMSGSGTTIVQGTTTVTGANFGLDSGRILRNVGTVNWTSGTLNLNATASGGSGRIDNALGALFDAQGNNTLNAIAFGDLNTLAGFPAFNNAGTFRKSTGTGTTTVDVAFNNTGLVDVQIGTVSLTGNVTQHAGNVLTGGSWRVSGNGALELNESGAVNIVTNQGDVSLVGAAANFARINTLTNNQGAFRLLGARNFTAGGAFSNSGVLQLAGGAFGAPSLSNTATGEIVGFGTITPTVLNSGLVRAAGGTLTAAGGIDGQSGTLQSDADGTLVLGANSDGDFLVNNGNLVVGGFNVTVAADYTNANFGVGNAFNARANVSGAGQIVASGDVAQALTGQVTDGNSGIAQLTFGNIHVGDVVNRTFQVANTGSSGPSLRGALQTTVNGGNVTDNRLSGSGVTADNFGPLNTGTATADFTVSFAGSSAGALSNQRVAIVNNFDNVAEQVLGISGAVYRYASPSAHTPAPVVFANSRVGDVLSRALSVSNTAPADGFSEALDASIGGATAGVTSNGGAFSGLIAGATNNTSLSVGLDTTSAGAKLGTATITLASNGTGSSGLGLSSLGTQTVNVSGDVYRLASAGAHSPEPVVFANRHVGDAATQALSLTNTAANDGFSERLNASIGGATAGITSNSASFSLLGAGATNNSSLVVGIDTATAGAKLGTATITLASDGTGTSGFGALSLGTQTVNVSGDVYRLASASTMAAIQFGNVHVGDVVSQALSLTNTAANDGFSERLNASFESVSDARILASGSVTQLAAGATDGSTLAIALDTSTAGSLTGFARVRLTSDGTGTSGLGLSDLGVQNVGVTTNVAVYRYAEGLVENAVPIELGAYRVGDAAGTVGLIVSNVAANDGFSERLNASAGVTSAGFTATGNVNLLNAGASNNTSLTVGLDTATSGTKSGTTTVDFVSDGAGTSNLGQSAAGSQSVALQGRVYAQAVATVQGSGVDFGIVHVGEVVAAQSVTVSNDAAGALNDSLLGSISSVAAGFTGSGTLGLTGLAAGASSSALSIGLDTSAAGVFNGNAALAFASHNTELADFDLGLTNVALNAQVNNFANPVLTQAGLGTFTANGANFTLDFGFVAQGTSGVTSLLQLTNLVTGPADTLGATYDFTTGPFALGGFNAFNGLVAGASQSLTVSFDAVTSGVFEQVVGIHLFGENASGFHGDLGSFQLTLRAEVAPVPVPAAVWLFGTGLLGLWGRRRVS